MEIDTLFTWVIGVVVTVMVPLWARTAAAISRNGREVSELRGRIVAMESADASLANGLNDAHRRIGGIGRTADTSAGELRQVRSTLGILQQSRLTRGGGDGVPERD